MPKIEVLLKAYTAVVMEVSDRELETMSENGIVPQEIEDRAISLIKEEPEWQLDETYPYLVQEEE